MQAQELEPLIGEWTTEVRMPGHDEVIRGRTTFEWLEGGGYLIQRAEMEDPVFPRGVMVIGPATGGGRVVQHYFDSRGIARVYAMTFDGRSWTLERHAPDCTPLSFHQRWLGTFEDEDTIRGRWETSPDGRDWQLDFELAYRRVR